MTFLYLYDIIIFSNNVLKGDGVMEERGFKTVYFGSDTIEAQKLLDSGSCAAIISCENGYGVALLDGERVELTSGGCIALILREESQGITVSADFEGWFYICVGRLSAELLDYYLQGKAFLFADGGKSKAFQNRIMQRKPIYELGAFEFHSVLHKLFSDRTARVNTGPASVEAIKEYIDTHTDKKITLEELSKMFFISKTQIFRLFTASYGIAPMRYMLKRKIEVSKEMLIGTDMRIAEIAEALCFTDSKHFTKTFRNLTGMLPREFRKKEETQERSDRALG